ncbi:MAG: hypothetical protein HOV97_04905 [Nonomuraea sp.]|nr:hypothetical protein [Nonomuraea sp.]
MSSTVYSKAGADAALTPAPSVTAPASPALGQVWVSSSIRDAVIPTNPAERPVVVGSSGENTAQEPITWQDGANINMLYTGSGLVLRQCPIAADPLVAANWVKYGTAAVIGGGAAGVAGTVAHASLYQEGSTLYVFGIDTAANAVKVFTAAKSAPTAWTGAGTVLSTFPTGATAWGNTYVVKDDDGTYVMFIEYLDASGIWQMGQATSATGTGTYTMQVTKMTSHYGYGGTWSGGGGAFVAKENGEWVLLYHGMPGSSAASKVLPTEVFRATAPSLRADNWTPLNGGRPILRRITQYEVDQVADIDVVTLPSGVRYAFWTGVDNRSPMQARIHGAKLAPVRRRWNGTRWVSIDQHPDPLERGSAEPSLPLVKKAASDKTVATTAVTDLITLAAYAPVTRDYEIEFTASCRLTGVATDEYLFEAILNYDGARIYPLGAIGGNGGGLVNLHFKTKVIQQTIGTAIPVVIRVTCPTGGQFQCRPSTAPTKEQMAMTVTPVQTAANNSPAYS